MKTSAKSVGADSLPNFALEERLLRTNTFIGGMDEVGRGAIAGPVAVGIAVVNQACAAAIPAGIADSKLLSVRKREALVEPVKEWLVASAVGYAQAAEIDELGINHALALAGRRAYLELPVKPEMLILDGSYDWFSVKPEQTELFSEAAFAPEADSGQLPPAAESRCPQTQAHEFAIEELPAVVMQVKADRSCVSVAAASVLAKVARDKLMSEYECGYHWDKNAGYGTKDHAARLRERGLSAQHRRSFCTKILAQK